MKALLIIDVQNDFMPGGSLPVPHGDEIISFINAAQEKFELIVATKDWHPPRHFSFASTHGKRVGETIRLGNTLQELWPDHCIQGSKGADFPPSLKTSKIAKIFYKGSEMGVDSYSAFFDNARLRSTGLETYLKERGVDALYVVGVATEYCVKYSVLDALSLGFKVYLLEAGCRGLGATELALKEMEKKGAKRREFPSFDVYP